MLQDRLNFLFEQGALILELAVFNHHEVLFGGIFLVDDSALQHILDNRHECGLAPLIQRHDRIDMIFFVGGFGQYCDHNLKQFYYFFYVVVLGDFDQVDVFGFDGLVYLNLKVLLNK